MAAHAAMHEFRQAAQAVGFRLSNNTLSGPKRQRDLFTQRRLG
jgi:hypothetical protein